MRPRRVSGVGSVLAWFLFPIAPALLGSTCYQELNWTTGWRGGPDPRDWGWETWFVLIGPLLGYGFLAGSTLDLPDAPDRRGFRAWPSSRSLWVAIGPWVGFLAFVGIDQACQVVERPSPKVGEWRSSFFLQLINGNPAGSVLIVVLWWIPLAYGWLFVAWAALRRARRLGRLRRSLARGMALAVGFVGSLFGTFWAITEAWRGYFFDPRIMPAVIAGASLALMSGCANTITYGEVRRRELFQSMLVSWLLGLALAWRWWSRPRSKPPGAP